jgi:hypothetical protein
VFLLEDVADDVVGHLYRKERIEQPEAEPSHVGSRPTSRPADIRRRMRNVDCRSRFP